jgi:hypothetical protein
MNMPNVSSNGSMGINKNYFGKIVGCVDQPEEVFIKQRVDNVTTQLSQKMDQFIKKDNGPDDLCDKPGKYMGVSEDKNKKVSTIAEFCPETKNPKQLKMTNEDGSMTTNVTWGEKGELKEVKEERVLEKHREKLHITNGACKGTLVYEEHYLKR